MPIDALVQLGTLGGFAFAAGVLLLILKALFDAWRKGELVSRSVHDDMVKSLREENTALRQDNRDGARELARLAEAYEKLAGR